VRLERCRKINPMAVIALGTLDLGEGLRDFKAFRVCKAS
jgi:hypothetical protein